MSLLRVLVITFATLSLFAGFAAAGKDDGHHHHDDDYDYDYDHHPEVYYPKCYGHDWDWTYNSIGQNPCEIAAYLLSTCHDGYYSFPPLIPGKKKYDSCEDSECECNPVIYSLISACEACQGGTWSYYKKYIYKCKKVQPRGCFPYPIPYGTRVPKWALLDVEGEDYWNPDKAKEICEEPEYAPGTTLSG